MQKPAKSTQAQSSFITATLQRGARYHVGILSLLFGVILALFIVQSLFGTMQVIDSNAEAGMIIPIKPSLRKQLSLPRRIRMAKKLKRIASTYSLDSALRTWGDEPVQLVYLAGVEGSGHETALPLIKSLAVYAGLVFHQRDKDLRKTIYWHSKNFAKILTDAGTAASKGSSADQTVDPAGMSNRRILAKSSVKTVDTKVYKPGKHVFFEDASFPTVNANRQGSFQDVASDNHYNLNWIVKNAKAANTNIKFLILHRNFVNAVWEYKNLDGGFRGHATVLAHFTKHLESEIRRVEDRAEWRSVKHHWFTPEFCPLIVPPLCEYLGWPQPEDVEHFCGLVPFITPQKKVISMTSGDKEWIEEFEMDFKSKLDVIFQQDKFLIDDFKTD